MRFKQNWHMLYRDLYGTMAFLYTEILVLVFIPCLRDGDYFVVFFSHLLFLGYICVFLAIYYFGGAFTNIIILDDIGITFQQRKKPPQQIRWEQITKIIRTRYIGGKTMVFWGVYSGSCGDEIWFDYSQKIENYILSNHPELQPLFPDKKDLRKWQKWDKSLRW